jgi:hypothetical protein
MEKTERPGEACEVWGNYEKGNKICDISCPVKEDCKRITPVKTMLTEVEQLELHIRNATYAIAANDRAIKILESNRGEYLPQCVLMRNITELKAWIVDLGQQMEKLRRINL